MKPGDKVRFLRSSGEGFIRKINSDKTVDVEIEDGFIIPVLQNEIVVVASEEKEIFRNQPQEIQSTTTFKTASLKGIYLCFNAFNENLYSIELVNSSQFEILYTISELENDQPKGLGRGILKAGSMEKIGQRNMTKFDQWAPLFIQVLYFEFGYFPLLNPFSKKVSFNAANFFKHKKKHPVNNTDSYVFELEPEAKLQASASQIQEAMEGKEKEDVKSIEIPSTEIDLHIEKLDPNHKKIQPDEILNIQFSHFDTMLEKAIAFKMEEITFIHGVGNGILKNKIQKHLSQHNQVEYFKDARKDKFGYGATYAKLKR